MEDLVKQSSANICSQNSPAFDEEGREIVRYFKASKLPGLVTQLKHLVKDKETV
jgi:hypothetical protein